MVKVIPDFFLLVLCAPSSSSLAQIQRKSPGEELTLGLASPGRLPCTITWLKADSRMLMMHSRSRSAPAHHFDVENWYQLPSISKHEPQSAAAVCQAPTSLQYQRSALEQDVVELQNRLNSEQAVRSALERAVGQSLWAISPGHRHLSKQTKELINEISMLEEEVGDLEQHVLSLYRRFFERCSSSLFSGWQRNEVDCTQAESHRHHSKTNRKHRSKEAQCRQSFQCTNISVASQGSSSAEMTSVSQPKLEQATYAYFQKLLQSKVPREKNSRSNPNSYNEDGPRPLREYLSETPNKLSEELVRCMASIYCKLSDPPLPHFGVPDSPSSSCTSSSTSLSSAQGIPSDGWSPGRKAEHLYDAQLMDPFQTKGQGKTRFVGAYSCMVEVPWISVDKDRLSYATRMLRDFRSMVEQLEKVDPSQLTHNEKLAFWVNIYNALLMHAYLAYGIPRNNIKRMALLQRAAYKIGGRSINAHTIENSILRCRLHRPNQWLQHLFSPGSKLKAGDERQSYAIETPEPVVCFALCCGGRSDPAVRVYTSKNVHEELECSKREFLQASIGLQSNKKVLLPKILEWYSREAAVSANNILDFVSQYLDDKENATMLEYIRSKPHRSSSHCIEWVPYNFNFRYLFDDNLARRFLNATDSISPSCRKTV